MSTALRPPPALIERFAADFAALRPHDGTLGVAVSGGPDSLALLLLAAAARPGSVQAATVDHGLRREAAAEARFVADVCRRLDVPHDTLRVRVGQGASLQAQARAARYRVIGDWAIERGLANVATGHHADDQAETLLMRLARGAGVSGLAGTRRKRLLEPGILLVRPLLGWRRDELADVVAAAGLTPVDDPANRDPRHDRTRFRGLLQSTEWADPERLALSARWLADADEAIDWAIRPLVAERIETDGEALMLAASDLPREFQRRLLLEAFRRLDLPEPRGPELERARTALRAGSAATLAGRKLRPVGGHWRIERAPPRRR